MDNNHQPVESPATSSPSAEEPKQIEDDTNRNDRRWPQPVLPEELTREQPTLEKVYIGVLKDQRSISKAIAVLANLLPCPRHLKRCHGRRIYLTALDRLPEGVNGPTDLLNLLGQKGLDLSLLEAELEVVEVPREPARSKAQMRAAVVHWPVHFHPDPRIEALLSGEALSSGGPILLDSLEACARLVAKISSSGCGGAAIILEPPALPNTRPRLLAVAVASEEKHPLWHAAMLAIDLVARRQKGGAWPLVNDDEINGDSPKPKKPRREEGGPLVFPPELILEPEILAQSKITNDREESADAYLCTGYWIVLDREPCAMCAMALLHSRVARIFYGESEPKGGVLGSRALMHTLPGLNHRYEVWRGLVGTK